MIMVRTMMVALMLPCIAGAAVAQDKFPDQADPHAGPVFGGQRD